MIKSLYSGVTGLKTHNQRMDVIGNNIANVNTTAYKAGTVTFKDVYYQTKSTASGGSFTAGGLNPKQTGYGVQLGSISKVMTQSGLTFSDSVFDCALQGSGFFQVMDSAGNVFYTRLGRFDLDNFGNLVDPNGNIVLGVSGDPTGIPASSQRINLQIPPILDTAAYGTAMYQGHGITFEAGRTGPNGNISINIKNGNVPFAVLESGTTLNVTLDLNKDFAALASSVTAPTEIPGYQGLQGIGLRPNSPGGPAGTVADEAAWDRQLTELVSTMISRDVKEAIRLGGVNVDPAIFDPEAYATIPTPDYEAGIKITFESIPDASFLYPNPTAAQKSTNSIQISPTIRLDFEMDKAGAQGNQFEVDISNTGAPTGLPTARWDGNVLKINLPADGQCTIADIQTAIDQIVGVTGRSTAPPYDLPAALTDIPLKSIKVSGVQLGTGGTTTPYMGDIETGTTGAPPTNSFMDFMRGKPALRMAMANGKDSFFAEAFGVVQNVKLRGGYDYTPQTPDDCEIIIDQSGVIYGQHAIHGMLMLGRIDIVDFVNPNGLNQVGTSYYTASLNSGDPRVKTPSDDTATTVVAGALEMSNVDLSQEFSDMIITQRGFQANSRIITVSDTLLEELINLKR